MHRAHEQLAIIMPRHRAAQLYGKLLTIKTVDMSLLREILCHQSRQHHLGLTDRTQFMFIAVILRRKLKCYKIWRDNSGPLCETVFFFFFGEDSSLHVVGVR